jgi:cardiolipin synthase
VTGLHPGHQVRLLQGSSEFFAALMAAMDAATKQVRLETYIFDFTGSGADMAQALVRTARRQRHAGDRWFRHGQAAGRMVPAL